jgi:hypothetical protein
LKVEYPFTLGPCRRRRRAAAAAAAAAAADSTYSGLAVRGGSKGSGRVLLTAVVNTGRLQAAAAQWGRTLRAFAFRVPKRMFIVAEIALQGTLLKRHFWLFPNHCPNLHLRPFNILSSPLPCIF